MCKLATVRTLGPHEVLLEEGAVPSCMYIVAEGELVLHKRVEFTKDKSVW